MEEYLASLGLDAFIITFVCASLLFGGLVYAGFTWDKANRKYMEQSISKETPEVQAKKDLVRKLVRTEGIKTSILITKEM